MGEGVRVGWGVSSSQSRGRGVMFDFVWGGGFLDLDLDVEGLWDEME